MSRPSLKDERRAEILDAYGRCIARYGVEGATLEKTAEEAGLARALIRHNVGNKDELLDAFLDRFLSDSAGASDGIFASLPADDRVQTLVKWLFDPRYSNVHEVNVTNALLIAATDRPELARRLRRWTFNFIAAVRAELQAAFPDAPDEKTEAVATGVAAIYFNFDSMTSLGRLSKLRRSSEAAAHSLISTLNS